MTMRKAFHPRDDVNRLYVSRKEGGRGLARTENIVDASIQRLEDYTDKRGETIQTPRGPIEGKQKWEEKQL